MSEKITAMIEEIKALTVLELSDLVKAIEEEFGVSAAAPVAVAAAAAAPAAEEKRLGSGKQQKSERDSFCFGVGSSLTAQKESSDCILLPP